MSAGAFYSTAHEVRLTTVGATRARLPSLLVCPRVTRPQHQERGRNAPSSGALPSGPGLDALSSKQAAFPISATLFGLLCLFLKSEGMGPRSFRRFLRACYGCTVHDGHRKHQQPTSHSSGAYSSTIATLWCMLFMTHGAVCSLLARCTYGVDWEICSLTCHAFFSSKSANDVTSSLYGSSRPRVVRAYLGDHLGSSSCGQIDAPGNFYLLATFEDTFTRPLFALETGMQ